MSIRLKGTSGSYSVAETERNVNASLAEVERASLRCTVNLLDDSQQTFSIDVFLLFYKLISFWFACNCVLLTGECSCSSTL